MTNQPPPEGGCGGTGKYPNYDGDGETFTVPCPGCADCAKRAPTGHGVQTEGVVDIEAVIDALGEFYHVDDIHRFNATGPTSKERSLIDAAIRALAQSRDEARRHRDAYQAESIRRGKRMWDAEAEVTRLSALVKSCEAALMVARTYFYASPGSGEVGAAKERIDGALLQLSRAQTGNKLQGSEEED